MGKSVLVLVLTLVVLSGGGVSSAAGTISPASKYG